MKRVKSWAALVLTVAAVGTLLLSRLAFLASEVVLLINLSPSAPRGMYRIIPTEKFQHGQMVAFRPPQKLLDQLGPREWLNPTYPFIKPIGALPGDTVCSDQKVLKINSQYTVDIAEHDSNGVRLPSFSGCQVVIPGTFVPISQYSQRSFDGRYFGAIETSRILGAAIPIFIWK